MRAQFTPVAWRTGTLLSEEEIQRLRALPPSVQLKRKGLYTARKGWSRSEDDAMLRAFLWCVSLNPKP